MQRDPDMIRAAIRREAARRGIRYDVLARVAGQSPSTVHRWLAGKSRAGTGTRAASRMLRFLRLRIEAETAKQARLLKQGEGNDK